MALVVTWLVLTLESHKSGWRTYSVEHVVCKVVIVLIVIRFNCN